MNAKKNMSLHCSDSDVEEVPTSYTRPSFDALNTTNLQLLEYHSHDNSLRSSTAFTARNLKRSTPRESSYFRLWARVANLFADWWMGELLAILLSIIAFLAIVVILRRYDDHTLPKFPRNVPLNFVVSSLATVSKSSLLLAVASAFGQFKWLWIFSKQRRLQDLQVFDEASRGPLGAFKLLISRKSLSWASIGAVVTILCLIFDPFVQGLINISDRIVYNDNPASLLRRAENYPDLIRNASAVDIRLLNDINDAVFNPNPQLETQPQCPSGNCTWPTFTSLGFCSKCEDISQGLRNGSTYFDKTFAPDDQDHSHKDRISENHQPNKGPLSILEYTVRNYTYGFPSLNGNVIQPEGGSFSINFKMEELLPAFFVKSLEWDNLVSFNFADGTSLSMAYLLTLIRVSTRYPDYGSVLSADLCALSYCAQKHNVSVSLNSLSSTILETVYGIKRDDGVFPWLSFIGDTINMTFPSPVHYTPRNDPVSQINKYLLNVIKSLTGDLSLIVENDDYQILFPSEPEIWAPSYQATSNIIGGFYSSANISMAMANIATVLTNWARDSSDVKITGQAGHTEFYIHVNWPWITFPTFLVTAGTIFSIAAMFETKRLGARIWKTSELALLFHGLEDFDQELNGLLRSSEMKYVASSTKIKGAKTSGGRWMLRREKIPMKSMP